MTYSQFAELAIRAKEVTPTKSSPDQLNRMIEVLANPVGLEIGQVVDATLTQLLELIKVLVASTQPGSLQVLAVAKQLRSSLLRFYEPD